MIPLSERKLTKVELEMMKADAAVPDGALHMGFTCSLQVQAFDGADEGISASLYLAVPVAADTTLQDFESAALERAFDFLKRLGAISREDLSIVFEKTRQERAEVARAYYRPPNTN